jgi:hypothetical protein
MIIFLSVVLGLALLSGTLALIFAWTRRLRSQAISTLRVDAGLEKVYNVEGCNFFGRQSKGYRQFRGNGVLALTDKGIHFRMLLPRKYLFVPLGFIKEVSNPRSFLGKYKAKDLLRVDFTNDAGKEDACAWLVGHLGWWNEALVNLLAGREPPPRPQKRSR